MEEEWNPVEGLTSLDPTEVRVGDIIRIKQSLNVPHYLQFKVVEIDNRVLEGIIVVKSNKGSSCYLYTENCSSQAYLVERPKMDQPTDIGSMVWGIFKGSKYVFLKLDADGDINNAWTVFNYYRPSYVSPTPIRITLGDERWFVTWEWILNNTIPSKYEWGQEI